MTTPSLPPFRYHPDPVATGMVKPSAAECACCGRARGFIYVGPVYAIANLRECICPWCIADGKAAAKFSASFVDDHPLLEAALPEAVVDEVSLRTPGYVSWQQEQWLAHCGDACEFHGDASVDDVANASPDTKTQWLATYEQVEEGWHRVTTDYQPGGDSALYKFVCRHCRQILFGWDMS